MSTVMVGSSPELALWVAGLVDAGIRGTVLLAAAGFIAWLLRDSSAGARHLVWALALSGLLALPVVSPFLPPLGAAGLPSVERLVRAHLASPGSGDAGAVTSGRGSDPVAVPGAPDGRRTARAEGAAALSQAARSAPVAEGERSGIVPALPVSLGTLLSVLWLLGPLTVLGLLLAGKLRIGWIAREAEPIDEEWEGLLRRLCRRVGVRRRVRLLRIREPLVPMAWGIVRPRILLPSSSESWDRETRRSVLLHELAHVKRVDSVTQLLGRLAAALFWFHPLVWVAVARLRLERERACDDLVLRTGTRATDYARQLVALARDLRTIRAPVPGSGAVGRSQFTERLESLLDPGKTRDPVPSSVASAGLVAAGILVLAAGMARPPLATAAVGEPAGAEKAEAPPTRPPAPVLDLRRETSVSSAPPGGRGADERGRPSTRSRASIGGELSDAAAGMPPVPRPDPVEVEAPSLDPSEAGRDEDGVRWIPAPAPAELTGPELPAPEPAEAGAGPSFAGGSAASAARLRNLALQAPTRENRLAAVEALADLPGGTGARPLGRIAASHTEPEVRDRAVTAIGEIDGEWTVPVLVNLVQGDADLSVRHHALEVLAKIDRPAAARALMQIARSHPDPEIRKEAAFRLVDTAAGEALARYVETA